jgi:hypothetical protein
MEQIDMEFEAPDVSKTTIAELTEFCKSIVLKREEVEEFKKQYQEKNTELDKLEARMCETLEALGLTSFDFGQGEVQKRIRTSVRVPHGPERDEFFNYLREKNAFDALITVNSQTLNSWYKREVDIAAQSGQVFNPPGLGLPSGNISLAIKLKK